MMFYYPLFIIGWVGGHYSVLANAIYTYGATAIKSGCVIKYSVLANAIYTYGATAIKSGCVIAWNS